MVRRGQLAPENARSIELEAVIDTGAVRSVIPVHIARQLGLEVRHQTLARYADGRSENVGISEGVIFEWKSRDTLEEALILGDEVLIGQTVMKKLDLLADCAGRKLMPHPDRPNQPVSMVPTIGVHYMNAGSKSVDHMLDDWPIDLS